MAEKVTHHHMQRVDLTKLHCLEPGVPAVLSVRGDYTGNLQCWLQTAYLQAEKGGLRLVSTIVTYMRAESKPEQPHLEGQAAVEVISTGIC